MQLNRLRRFLVVPLATLVVGSICSVAQAQLSDQDTGLNLRSNPRIELSGNPGDKLTGSLLVENVSDKSLAVSTSALDVLPGDNNGHPQFLLPDEAAKNPSPYPLAQWVQITPAQKTMAAHETATYSYTITIPANASPGDHYGSLGFGVTAGSTNGSGVAVGINHRVYALAFVTVSGDVHYGALITKFAVEKSSKVPSDPAQPSINLRTGYLTTTEIKNTGNTHFRARDGKIVIRNAFGNRVVTVPIDPDVNKIVVPGGKRLFNNSFIKHLGPGRYTAKVSFVYGAAAGPFQTASKTLTFYVMPPWWWWLILLLIVALLFLLIYSRRRRKEANGASRPGRNSFRYRAPRA